MDFFASFRAIVGDRCWVTLNLASVVQKPSQHVLIFGTFFGNTKSEYHAIPEQRLDRGAGEVCSRTTAETGDKQTDLRACLTARPERMTQ